MNLNFWLFIAVSASICSLIFFWSVGTIDSTAFAGFTALLIGILGIFKEQVLAYFYTPKLDFEFKLKPPDSHRTTMRYKRNNKDVEFYTYYLRLNVSNVGDVRLENIEVLIKEKHILINGKFQPDKNFSALNLRWSNTHEITKRSIAPRLFKYCDFGHISDPVFSDIEADIAVGRVVLIFDFEVKSNTGSYILTPGTYRFKVIATSDNADSVTKIFEMDFPGKWSESQEEMLERNISIREVIA